jgi:antitoxin Phd
MKDRVHCIDGFVGASTECAARGTSHPANMVTKIAMWGAGMRKQYSIAQARDHFPGIVHEVERGSQIELTRRGKPVAVLVSLPEYERLTSGTGGFWEALEKFRREADLEAMWEDGDPFEGVRDRSPGREFSW